MGGSGGSPSGSTGPGVGAVGGLRGLGLSPAHALWLVITTELIKMQAAKRSFIFVIGEPPYFVPVACRESEPRIIDPLFPN
jgi:hypothetical protein